MILRAAADAARLCTTAGAAMLLWAAGCAWALDSGAVGVAATVVGKGHCTFNTTALTLDFGPIDPASSADVTASAALTFSCGGNGNNPIAFNISASDGQWSTGVGARRMRNDLVTTEFLGYSLAWTPISGSTAKNINQTLTVTGTIQPFQFQNSPSGSYTDSVALTLTP